jgi:hypothetical protein
MFGKLGTTLALAGAAVVFTTSLAVATEGTVTKMDEKSTLVRMGTQEYRVGMIPGAKVGDKVNCTEAKGKIGEERHSGMPGGSTGGTTSDAPRGSTGGSPGGTMSDAPRGPTGGPPSTPPSGSMGSTGGTSTTAMQMVCTKM